MQLKIMKNIIDSVKNRVKDQLILFAKKQRNKFAMIFSSVLIGSLGFIYAMLSIPPGEHLLLFVPIGASVLLVLYVMWGEIFNFIKLGKKIQDSDFESIYGISQKVKYDFPDEHQKLNPDEVKQLLQLSFCENDFNFFTNAIQNYGYITHDDVYLIYGNIQDRIQEEKDKMECAKEKNANFQQFLIENDLTENTDKEQVEILGNILQVHQKKLYAKSFNSKSTL